MKALVTGASSGIGRDISIYLSNKGYDIILVARDEKELNKTKDMLKTNGVVYPCDLSKEENVRKLYNEFKSEDIEILVNGSGFGLFGNSWETDLDTELKMIDVNLKAVHILTKLFLEDFVKRNSGYILNVASSAGFLSGPYLNTYYATKNYVTKWTLGIYEELRHINSNVHISCLCPGPVDTNFNKVAGGSFTIKPLTSKYVSEYAIDKMFKNKLIIIPGFTVRMGVFFNKFLPYKTSLKITYNIQTKKNKETK